MANPIVKKIIKEGVDSVKLSMLDEGTKKKILADVGEKLCKQNRFTEAIEIMTKAGDVDKLKELGDDFLTENRAELAALCFIPTKDKERLSNAAALCANSGNYELAMKAYEAAGELDMASLIQKNFLEE